MLLSSSGKIHNNKHTFKKLLGRLGGLLSCLGGSLGNDTVDDSGSMGDSAWDLEESLCLAKPEIYILA